jgi:S-adenosylmethionine decarboxylase
MTNAEKAATAVPMQGQHLLADIFGIKDERLQNTDFLIELLKDLAATTAVAWLSPPQVIVTPNCIIAYLLVEQGHIMLQIYPQHGYMAFDVLSLKDDDTDQVFNLLYQTFNARIVRKTTITRGKEV